MKVFITRKIPAIAEKKLAEKGCSLNIYNSDEPVPYERLCEGVANCDAIISTLSDKISREVIEKMNSCKIIANYAVGYNNIDINAAKEKNIIVTNTPDILTDATADLTLALILACCRRIPEGERLVRERQFTGWKPMLLLGKGLKGKTLGIVGAGRIGRAVAERASSFGLKIIYNSRKRNSGFEKSLSAEYRTLEDLLRQADIISVHCPLTEQTFHLFNESNLCLLKDSAVFINTARGEIVDEKILIEMLHKKRIFAAGLDVYENEPNLNEEFFKLDNVILLPHLGSANVETREKMAELCADNIIRVLAGEVPVTPVY